MASRGVRRKSDGDVTKEIRVPHGGTEANRIGLFRRGKQILM